MFRGVRRCWHCWRRKQDYQEKWPDLPVCHLVYYEDDPGRAPFIVFIDCEDDLDWKRDDPPDGEPAPTEDDKLLCEVRHEVAFLESEVTNWPRDLKLSIKRMLGEAIASALKSQQKRAMDIIERAKELLIQKRPEVSRYWTLQACITAGGLAGVAGATATWKSPAVIAALGATPHLLFLAFCSGAIGALFFVILRLGSDHVDPSAERRLHFAEGLARIVAGGIAGLMVGAMVKLGVVLPVFSQPGATTLAVCTAAMLGGASERLVPGILAKMESQEAKTKGGNP